MYRETWLKVALLGAVGAVASACGSGTDEHPDGLSEGVQLAPVSYSLTLSAPANVSFVDLAVGTTGGIEIEENASVRGHGSALAAITSVGSGGIKLEASAVAGDVYTKSELLLGPNAHLLGSAFAQTVRRAPNARIDGTITAPATLDPLVETTFSVTFPAASAPTLNVSPHQSRFLLPGRYLNAKVRGTLLLKSGAYYFDSFDLEHDGALKLEQHDGPTFVFVKDYLTLSGTTTSTSSKHEDLVIVQVSANDIAVKHSFHGVIAAPNAKLILGTDSSIHPEKDSSHHSWRWFSHDDEHHEDSDHGDSDRRNHNGEFDGAFYAGSVRLGAGSRLLYEPPNAFVSIVVPPGQDIQACTQLIRAPQDLEGQARDQAFQTAIARNCTMAGHGLCDTSIVGRANTDYALAAVRLIHQTIDPGHYLAIVRDRSRKLREARHDQAFATELCNGNDDDGDWIPNDHDRCPGTQELTATDDQGCPTNVIPRAPSAADVNALLSATNMPFKKECANAVVPPRATAGAFYRPSDLAQGVYILVTRVVGQPVGCPVWYEFDIQEIKPATGSTATYSVAFEAKEETTDLIGLGTPVPPGVIQFQALPTDAGTRGFLGQAGGTGARFRVRAMNGAGMRSEWTDWRLTDNDDCKALGFSCGN